MKIAHAALLVSTIFAMACSAGRTAAQQNTHVERPAIPARTEDVSTIEGIVKASYEAISGGVGVPRNWGRDRTLFDPESRSVAVMVDPKSGAITTKAKSEQDFADEADASSPWSGTKNAPAIPFRRSCYRANGGWHICTRVEERYPENDLPWEFRADCGCSFDLCASHRRDRAGR